MYGSTHSYMQHQIQVGTYAPRPLFPLGKIHYYKRIRERFGPREGVDGLRKRYNFALARNRTTISRTPSQQLGDSIDYTESAFGNMLYVEGKLRAEKAKGWLRIRQHSFVLKERGTVPLFGLGKQKCLYVLGKFPAVFFRHQVVFMKQTRSINLSKPAGHVMHQQFSIQQLYVLPTLYLCVLYLSENKQRLVPLIAQSDRFLYPR